MQIREYDGVDEELPGQPFFARWFCCMNKACKTTLVRSGQPGAPLKSSDPLAAGSGAASWRSQKRKDRPFHDSRSLPMLVQHLPLSYDRRGRGRSFSLADVLRTASDAQESEHRGHS
jgi:hypothetical protein